MNEHYEKWDRLAVPGLIVMALGLAVTGQAIVMKARRQGFLKWFTFGTLGLVLFNSGASMFGEAIKSRALYETELMQNLKS
ncbi:MAG TPA: hypothetical protein PKX07_01635 [Aggregatilineales bacterium]|nr:hypothetical protein [Aggregatilineales bacterium]